MSKIKLGISALLIIFVLLGYFFRLNKRVKEVVFIENPTNVYEVYPESGRPSQQKIIATLNKGEQCDLIGVRYSKDFQYYRIRLKDGRLGYLIYGDGFKVVSNSLAVEKNRLRP